MRPISIEVFQPTDSTIVLLIFFSNGYGCSAITKPGLESEWEVWILKGYRSQFILADEPLEKLSFVQMWAAFEQIASHQNEYVNN